MKTIWKILRILLKTIKWTFLIIVGLAIVSAFYNLSLPKQSKTVEYLSVKEKSFIAEEMNLHQKIFPSSLKQKNAPSAFISARSASFISVV